LAVLTGEKAKAPTIVAKIIMELRKKGVEWSRTKESMVSHQGKRSLKVIASWLTLCAYRNIMFVE